MNETREQRHLNNALVETARPAMYKTLKYWGKKPVNIWREFIECYCPEGGVVLDPFAGSDIAAFESIATNRNAISLDLNPMASFFIDVYMTDAPIGSIDKAVDDILRDISADPTYRKHFTLSRGFVEEHSDVVPSEYLAADHKNYVVYNYLWEHGEIAEVRVKASSGDGNDTALPALSSSLADFANMDDVVIRDWYPTDPLPHNPSISSRFLEGIGGNTFDHLWTKRNLYVLARIFNLICRSDEPLRAPLLAGFVHTLHLTTKMVVPRRAQSNRDYSGSWGRADYMVRARQLEQNPLVIFERGMRGRGGFLKALENYRERIGVGADKTHYVSLRPRRPLSRNAALNYGNVDVADLLDIVQPGSVDFVITDPPYGGLVQYMDLSMVWLVWLQHYSERYAFEPAGEITVKEGSVSRSVYVSRLVKAFKNIYTALKDDGYMVVTFHNQNIREWNDFIKSLRQAGFIVDKVTHQKNARSGEANVANPYGTSGTDFYIRCVKHRDIDFTNDQQSLSQFIFAKTVETIAERCEPTPFEFITAGVLPEMIQAGYLNFNEPALEIGSVLKEYTVGDDAVFEVTEAGDSGLGDIWWFKNPARFINHPNMPLSQRVQDTVLAYLRRHVSVKFDDVLAEIFHQFPNGLTPDVRTLSSVLNKYADKSNGKWKLNERTQSELTRHSLAIEHVCNVLSKLNLKGHVGLREQHERGSNGLPLRDQLCHDGIPFDRFGIDDEKTIDRINQIDVVAFDDDGIRAAIEVESTTGFVSAISRCSNLDAAIPKIMVVPSDRVNEFLRRCADPQVKESFIQQNWAYLTTAELQRLSQRRNLTIEIAANALKRMDE